MNKIKKIVGSSANHFFSPPSLKKMGAKKNRAFRSEELDHKQPYSKQLFARKCTSPGASHNHKPLSVFSFCAENQNKQFKFKG